MKKFRFFQRVTREEFFFNIHDSQALDNKAGEMLTEILKSCIG